MPRGRLVIAVGGFNSAIDKYAEVDDLPAGAVVRLRNVRPLAGGKGLHVALACGTLGESVTLVGLSDASTRPLFDAALAPVSGRFVGIEAGAPIRTCFALRDGGGRTTELLEPGPTVTTEIAEALADAFAEAARSASHAALSGSLPPGMPPDAYATLVARVGRHRVALDTSGPALSAGLAAGPLLVKPNRQEATALLGQPIETVDQAAAAARALVHRGPQIVVLSLGHDGAIVRTASRALRITAPRVEARNTVGAGDCLLGGFLVALARGWSLDDSARFAVACGTAKVLHPETGVLDRADVEAIGRAVTVHTM